MTLPAALARRFLENPHVGRQLATGFQSVTLGAVLTLVSLALGIVSFLALQLLMSAFASRPELAETGVGPRLHLLHCLALYGFLALLLPFRVAGSIDGPRNDKAF